MEAANAERKLREHRQQIGFADLRGGAHDLPLRYLVDGVDVVHPFDSVPIALAHRIYPQIPGATVWFRPTPLADGHLRRASRLVDHPPLSAADTFSPPVQLCQ